MSSEPATKADVREAIDQAIDELRRTDLAEIREQMATKQDLAALRVELRIQFATKQELDTWGHALRAEMKQDLDTWGHALMAEMRRQINSNTESIRDWIKALQEQTAAVTGSANANTAALRADFEAHRDDIHVHRTPRRRRS